MKNLDLFSGSGSIGKAFAQQVWDVTSFDIGVNTDTDMKQNILEWDHSVFPRGIFRLCGQVLAVPGTVVPGGAPTAPET